VGRAAIIGWRDVLRPALLDESIDVALWPFDGELDVLLDSRQVVIAETYPAGAAVHIGIGAPGRGWSKRSQAHRAAKATAICHFAEQSRTDLAPEPRQQVIAGFGTSGDGEDRFDATTGGRTFEIYFHPYSCAETLLIILLRTVSSGAAHRKKSTRWPAAKQKPFSIIESWKRTLVITSESA
jgi:hypothetical protein